jgi:methyltransferase (TIGR00027 family)
VNIGQPSETARRVAAQRLHFERIPAPFGDPSSDDALAANVADGVEAKGTLTRYLEARTRFFDRAVVGGFGAGIEQAVVGAAGYDGRCFRYAKPGVKWFEVDHPSTQADKRARLETLGIPTDHVRFVAADFETDDVAAGLTGAGLNAKAPAVFTLEGVAVYLERATLASVLGQLRNVAAPGSRLAISLSVSADTGEGHRRRAAFQAAVEALGEPARSTVTPDEVDSFLGGCGWRAVDSGSETQERARSAGLILAEPVAYGS